MRNVQCSFLQYSNIIKESSNIIVHKMTRIKLNRNAKIGQIYKIAIFIQTFKKLWTNDFI